MPANDWAQKMLCIIVPNLANTSQWVLFVCSYTTITACLAQAPKKCTQSGNFQFDIKSPSDPTRLLCQMQENSSGTEFLPTICKFMKRMNFVIAFLRPSQNVKLGIFTGSLSVDGKEINVQKAWCSWQVVVLPCQAITHLTFSSPPRLNCDPSKTEYSLGKFNCSCW